MYTYFLEKNEKLSVWEICKREIDGHHTADGYFELHGSSALKSIDNGVGKMSSRESTSNVNFARESFWIVLSTHFSENLCQCGGSKPDADNTKFQNMHHFIIKKSYTIVHSLIAQIGAPSPTFVRVHEFLDSLEASSSTSLHTKLL